MNIVLFVIWECHVHNWKRKENEDGSENVTFKMNWRFFKLCRVLLQFAKKGLFRQISLELISWGPHSNLEREREFRRRLFMSSIKREIRHYHYFGKEM